MFDLLLESKLVSNKNFKKTTAILAEPMVHSIFSFHQVIPMQEVSDLKCKGNHHILMTTCHVSCIICLLPLDQGGSDLLG